MCISEIRHKLWESIAFLFRHVNSSEGDEAASEGRAECDSASAWTAGPAYPVRENIGPVWRVGPWIGRIWPARRHLWESVSTLAEVCGPAGNEKARACLLTVISWYRVERGIGRPACGTTVASGTLLRTLTSPSARLERDE